MKKITVISILLIIYILQLSAQKSKSVIYLKNGSIIYGTLVEVAGNQYKVEGNDGSILLFPSTDVEKYILNPQSFEGRKKNGPGFSLEAGFLLGSQTAEYVAPFSFNAVFQYTVDTKNIFGLGSGVEFLGETYTPVFFEFKRVVTSRKVSPFVFARSGMLFYLGQDDKEDGNYYPQYSNINEYHGGASFTAGTGISWTGEEIETCLSFAYRYAHTSNIQTDYNQQEVTYTNNYNRLEIKLGFKF